MNRSIFPFPVGYSFDHSLSYNFSYKFYRHCILLFFSPPACSNFFLSFLQLFIFLFLATFFSISWFCKILPNYVFLLFKIVISLNTFFFILLQFNWFSFIFSIFDFLFYSLVLFHFINFYQIWHFPLILFSFPFFLRWKDVFWNFRWCAIDLHEIAEK